MPTYLGVWSLGLFSPTFFSTSSKKKKKVPKKKNVLCVVKLIHTKTAQIKKNESLSAQIVGDLMLLTIEAVLHIRTKPLGSMWSRNRFLMHQS